MAKWYFTFGCGIDNLHRNGYHIIEALDCEAAREEMVRRFGYRWAFQYSEEEFGNDAEKYNLHEVK